MCLLLQTDQRLLSVDFTGRVGQAGRWQRLNNTEELDLGTQSSGQETNIRYHLFS
jgi:hypothetical protein